MAEEIWRPIPDYEKYFCSNFGRVKSFKKGEPRILTPNLSPKGYLRVNLHKNNKSKTFGLHRLVAMCFIPNPLGKSEVDHIDGNKLNNHVSNLRWATHEENMKYAVETGLYKTGADSYKAKLTAAKVIEIRENPCGLSTYKLAEKFSVDETTISLIQRGLSYKNVSGVIREKNNPQKLMPAQVEEIRENPDNLTIYQLAEKFSVNHTTISEIQRGLRYKNIGGQFREVNKHTNRKLNDVQREAIRNRYAQGNISMRALACECGVSESTIRNIIKGE